MSDVPDLPTKVPVPLGCPHTLRLLVPVKGPGGASQAIGYAISRSVGGGHVAVALLHVETLPAPGQPGTGALFVRARRMLERRDIDCCAYVRSGPVVFSILDAAEELDCSEIVVPAPARPLARLWSHRVVDALLAGQRSIPVVTVNQRGIRQPEFAATTPI